MHHHSFKQKMEVETKTAPVDMFSVMDYVQKPLLIN